MAAAEHRTDSSLLESTTPSSTTRRVFDKRELLATAKAIVIEMRKCTEAQAFDELLDVAQRNHVTILGVARDLIDLAAGTPLGHPRRRYVGLDHWEELLSRRLPRSA
ncbi:ANTAR domain-containing protein [Rhodococcus chondri]|uniref:ANTAR domain-containing protein n=1 Tax=Rhodococcus chondri TaxID=3065941 RepID=A0ABU7JTD5_9NOCA|nr:ANTAR domain-containing protein [Rhodococcus sp. CC-R104]MEE2032547.1 ANTAR domain-containing protein [Rhodococcus sp. CC-R104]